MSLTPGVSMPAMKMSANSFFLSGTELGWAMKL